ncbi:TIGR03619 family F420-dependent LLM class oxidoreductase [Trebonia sp.]|uniref:TIGR03619 family F420-dependent LLM class oxidoreductase n=1 Tax=Trebonia sp. TaxID=2767075 RepID=UPI00260E7573|nr:TIGR03619 family F420-dependent LLM class oxidoreductase [Trebonia sp.]
MRPHIGLVLPNSVPGGDRVLNELAEAAETLGYHSLWVTDHVVGVRAMRPVYESYWLEALTTLTWIAARTSTIRVGTGILVVPHRHPVLAAKMLATLDVLSDGRLDVGVGAGWSRVEFRGLGVEHLYDDRGKATAEALDVILACWRGGEISHEGAYYSFRHIESDPVPRQRPHPPIWVGGHSRSAMRRAARFADVWHPADLTPQEVSDHGTELDELAGRPIRRSVRIHVNGEQLGSVADLVDAYAAAGCAEVVLEFTVTDSGELTKLAKRAGEKLGL